MSKRAGSRKPEPRDGFKRNVDFESNIQTGINVFEFCLEWALVPGKSIGLPSDAKRTRYHYNHLLCRSRPKRRRLAHENRGGKERGMEGKKEVGIPSRVLGKKEERYRVDHPPRLFLRFLVRLSSAFHPSLLSLKHENPGRTT